MRACPSLPVVASQASSYSLSLFHDPHWNGWRRSVPKGSSWSQSVDFFAEWLTEMYEQNNLVNVYLFCMSFFRLHHWLGK
jgi:hypothetical protein